MAKNMKRLLSSTAFLLCSMIALAYDFSVDGKYYNITSADELTVELTVRVSGCYSGDIIIPAEVEYNDKKYSVTSIGYATFQYCSNLNSVTIPNSVTTIGVGAFANCI